VSRRPRIVRPAVLAFAGVALFCLGAAAGRWLPEPAEARDTFWSRLTSEERQRVLRNYCAYESLSLTEKEDLLERYRLWRSFSPEERGSLRDRWLRLTDEDRNRLRNERRARRVEPPQALDALQRPGPELLPAAASGG
jgi:hypothetical protein